MMSIYEVTSSHDVYLYSEVEVIVQLYKSLVISETIFTATLLTSAKHPSVLSANHPADNYKVKHNCDQVFFFCGMHH